MQIFFVNCWLRIDAVKRWIDMASLIRTSSQANNEVRNVFFHLRKRKADKRYTHKLLNIFVTKWGALFCTQA